MSLPPGGQGIAALIPPASTELEGVVDETVTMTEAELDRIAEYLHEHPLVSKDGRNRVIGFGEIIQTRAITAPISVLAGAPPMHTCRRCLEPVLSTADGEMGGLGQSIHRRCAAPPERIAR